MVIKLKLTRPDYSLQNSINRSIAKKKRLLKEPLSILSYAWAGGPPKVIGGIMGSLPELILIGPLALSNFPTLSCNARRSRLACSGVRIILDLTFALGTPGIILTKSITNSELEWVITAKLE